jgi:retron-type reverse transcriptase
MIEQILTRKNLLKAMRQVQKNHGSAGVDHMPVTKLSELLLIDKEELTENVRTGKYLPQPILGVEIPKENGKMRLLGIPTVTDRMLQQAVLQIITARFEFEFSDNNFGFRPNKSLHQAVLKAQGYINEGFQYVVDIDLKTFFDPQGSPLSPLLSNIMLHELDRELERQGLRFVRYADDFSIYTKTKSAARKVGNAIFKFLKDKLKLSINREKSGIRRPVNFTILGFGFVPTYVKGEKGKYQLVVSDKSWKKFKQKLNEVQRGWVNNFRMASIYNKLNELDGWLRNRLRYCIWHHWKKPEKKRRSLIRLGVEQGQAYAWSRSRMGGWTIAQSPILGTTITLDRLKKRGYVALLDIYNQISPQLNEPLYTRPVRTVV